MKKFFIGLVVVVVVLLVGINVLRFAASRDTQLNEIADCVVKTANYQGYSGNPHSQEAWNLFVGECI